MLKFFQCMIFTDFSTTCNRLKWMCVRFISVCVCVSRLCLSSGHSVEVNSLCPATGHSEFTSTLRPTPPGFQPTPGKFD